MYRHWGSVQAVRPIGGVEVYLYSFLTTTLEGVRDQRHAPTALYPRERHGTHCTGGWVGPRAGMDKCGKFHPPPGFEPWTAQPVESRYTDWAIPAHILTYALLKYQRNFRLNSVRTSFVCVIGQNVRSKRMLSLRLCVSLCLMSEKTRQFLKLYEFEAYIKHCRANITQLPVNQIKGDKTGIWYTIWPIFWKKKTERIFTL